MIWLTWQQHRKQALFALIGLAMLAAILVPTGRTMHHAVISDGLVACRSQERIPEFADTGKGPTTVAEEAQDCGTRADGFYDRYGDFATLLPLFLFLPVLFGFFFGAPLVARELEHGTHRFIWTQAVARRRWTVVKVTLVGGFAIAIAAAYTALVSWWSAPLALADRNQSSFTVPAFDLHGIAPLGYTAFALALGIFAGTVWRRTLPAMAATLVAYITARIAVTAWARPHLLSPAQRRATLGDLVPNGTLRGDWVLASGVYDPARHAFIRDRYLTCPPDLAVAPGQGPCGYPIGAVNLEIYQPRDRLLLLQSLEAGIFIALAVLLIVMTVRLIRRIS